MSDVKENPQPHEPPEAPAQTTGAGASASPLSGKAKWFDPKRGFGFLVSAEGKDVFVHFSQIQGEGYKTLKPDEPVTYVMGEGKRGPEATRVVRTAPPAPTPEEVELARKIKEKASQKQAGSTPAPAKKG